MYIINNLLYVPFFEMEKLGMSAMCFIDSTQRMDMASKLIKKYNQEFEVNVIYETIIGISNGCIVIQVSNDK